MTKMIALKPHRYGEQRKTGDKFEVAAKDLRLVKALGWSKEVPPDQPAPAPAKAAIETRAATYASRDQVAAPAEPINTQVLTAETQPASDAGQAEKVSIEANTFAEQTPAATERPKRQYTRRNFGES